jgi:NADH-quinone oxidoreductase subunit N
MDSVLLTQFDIESSLSLIVLAAGILLLLLASAFYKGVPLATSSAVILICSAIPLLAIFGTVEPGATAYHGFLYVDDFAHAVSLIILIGSVLCVLLSARGEQDEVVSKPGDYYTLLLLSVLGALVFANSAELITMFLGLELMSMPLYCLCGAALSRSSSAESAMKYFFLGSFASAFLLFGIALLFGLTGTTAIPLLGTMLPTEESALIFFAFSFLAIGLGFKLGAVPLHFWAPDVYQGAPTPITAFMSTVVKASAVVVSMRILWSVFGASDSLVLLWSGVIWIMSLLTMVVGNLVAIQQRSLKRLLAYSSIAHAGYILMALLVPDAEFTSAAILFYLLSYTVMTLGAFAVLIIVGGKGISESGGDDITIFNRLGTKRPIVAAAMSIFLFSLAGLPPGMAGLFGKFYLFNSAVRGDYVGLAIVGVLASAVSCYYYLRIIVAMYFIPESVDSAGKQELIEVRRAGRELPVLFVIAICVLAVIVLGIVPGLVFDLLSPLGQSLFV